MSFHKYANVSKGSGFRLGGRNDGRSLSLSFPGLTGESRVNSTRTSHIGYVMVFIGETT